MSLWVRKVRVVPHGPGFGQLVCFNLWTLIGRDFLVNANNIAGDSSRGMSIDPLYRVWIFVLPPPIHVHVNNFESVLYAPGIFRILPEVGITFGPIDGAVRRVPAPRSCICSIAPVENLILGKPLCPRTLLCLAHRHLGGNLISAHRVGSNSHLPRLDDPSLDKLWTNLWGGGRGNVGKVRRNFPGLTAAHGNGPKRPRWLFSPPLLRRLFPLRLSGNIGSLGINKAKVHILVQIRWVSKLRENVPVVSGTL